MFIDSCSQFFEAFIKEEEIILKSKSSSRRKGDESGEIKEDKQIIKDIEQHCKRNY